MFYYVQSDRVPTKGLFYRVQSQNDADAKRELTETYGDQANLLLYKHESVFSEYDPEMTPVALP